VTARGVVWSTSVSPTVALSTRTIDGTGTGSFTSSITGLAGSTTYYVRAYATNSAGTAYGAQLTIATSAPVAPTLTTTTLSAVTATTASSGGNITTDGGAGVTQRGVVWSTSVNPTVALSTKTTEGAGSGSFASAITSLVTNTTYYVRAYATNSVGTAYGNEYSFTTLLAIGEAYGGGKIAYILQVGDPGYSASVVHGLIVALSHQSTGVRWHNGSNVTTAATASALGTGAANTNTIVALQGSGTYAAKLCYDLTTGGFSDWHLPSLIELNKLYSNRAAIGGFNTSYYWSSTENNLSTAMGQNFGDGSQGGYSKAASVGFSARAVRTF
jgi:hypothetical protein